MIHTFDLAQIQENINTSKELEELILSQKSAFLDFSSGLYNVPAPMQFIFPGSGSDCHIKSGYRQGNPDLVIKIAGSNPFGNGGFVLMLDINTYKVKAILQDESFLTTLRTALAGMIMLELIPWAVKNIGIIGSGNLAKKIYNLTKQEYPNTNIMLYARNSVKAAAICDSLCDSVENLVAKCDVVFTTTSATTPFITDTPQDTNLAIIALGSDDEHKSEIQFELFENADLVIVDSKLQATKFGDVSRALKANIIAPHRFIELGSLLKSGIPADTKTIIADFSGIGAQDVAMAEFVLARLVPS